MVKIEKWSSWPIKVELYLGDTPPAGSWQHVGWACWPHPLPTVYIGLKVTVNFLFIKRTFYWLYELRRC